MRGARKKVKNQDSYYHCYSRIAGPKDLYLFTDVDKEKENIWGQGYRESSN